MNKIKGIINFIYTHPLGKKHRIKCVLRLLLWQFQSTIFPSRFFVKDFIGGVKFYARKGLNGVTGNIYCGLHEFNDMGFLLHFLRKGDCFFDIGANVGAYTLLASGVCKAKSTTIEPVPSTFNILEKNVELNQLSGQVSLINSGAASGTGTLTFSSEGDTTNHVVARNEAVTGINVTVIAIDSLLNISEPTLIKIDVEGYETEVLNGMSQTLSSPKLKAIIIELNGSGGRYGFDDQQIEDLLTANGFNSYGYNPFTRHLVASERRTDGNTIYCRDIDFIVDRVTNSPGIVIMGEVI